MGSLLTQEELDFIDNNGKGLTYHEITPYKETEMSDRLVLITGGSGYIVS